MTLSKAGKHRREYSKRITQLLCRNRPREMQGRKDKDPSGSCWNNPDEGRPACGSGGVRWGQRLDEFNGRTEKTFWKPGYEIKRRIEDDSKVFWPEQVLE